MEKGRTRSEQKLDFVGHCDSLEKEPIKRSAFQHFYRKPYETMKKEEKRDGKIQG